MSEPRDRLKQARIAAGYRTSQALARRVNVAGPTVRAHESGQNGLRPDMAAKYAAALGVTPEWLLFGTSSVASSFGIETLQPASRPSGSEEMGRHFTLKPESETAVAAVAGDRVTLKINATVSIGTAARILAMIEEDHQ